MLSMECTNDEDVDARVKSASKAFGALSKCVFRSSHVSIEAKRAAYVALVLSVLLYGCESWCLTAKLWAKLRVFHHSCARTMCRINPWYSWKCRITTESTLQKLSLRSIEVYTARRQLQWAGHVARMGKHRLPRKMLTAWCYSPRPNGRPEFTYGESLKNALKRSWHERTGSWVSTRVNRSGPW